MAIKWIIFDAMGVIFEVGDDTNELLVPYIQKLDRSISKKQINESYIEASLGEISSADFWSVLGFDKYYPEVERNYLDNYLKIDPKFIEVANNLSQNYSLAILSNDVKEWSRYLCNKFNLNNLFKIAVISGDVGYRKPDKMIYQILLNKINTSASHCLFIDDQTKNLLPASKMGFKTIIFNRNTAKENSRAFHTIKKFSELFGLLKKFMNDEIDI